MDNRWEDDRDDPEYDDDDEETDVLACPACGADVYEDAEQCPHCGEYITPGSTHPFAGRGFWFVGLGLVGIVILILVLIVGGF